MKQTIIKARKALVAMCLEAGIDNTKDIQLVAKEVSRSCTKSQVAGVKARLCHPTAWK